MRLLPLLSLLVAAPSCFVVAAEATSPPPDDGGFGGSTGPTCENDPSAFCDEQACRVVSECGELCLASCLRWAPLPLEGPRPKALVSAALLCDEPAAAAWLFGGDERTSIVQPAPGACHDDPTFRRASNALYRLVPGQPEAHWEVVLEDDPAATDRPRGRFAAAILPIGPRSFVVFGGMRHDTDPRTGCAASEPEVLGDAWRWSDGVWTELKNVELPPARFGAFVATDPTSGSSYVFGGSRAVQPVTFATFGARDAWRFDPREGTFMPVATDLWPSQPDDLALPQHGVGAWLDGRGPLALGGRDGDSKRNHGERLYQREAWLLREGHLESVPELDLPFDAELFGVAQVPGLGYVLHRGYAGREGLDPGTWRWDDVGGWQLLQGPGTGSAGGATPGENASFAMTRCEPFGGVLLFGGELGGTTPTSGTWLLSTPPPP